MKQLQIITFLILTSSLTLFSNFLSAFEVTVDSNIYSCQEMESEKLCHAYKCTEKESSLNQTYYLIPYFKKVSTGIDLIRLNDDGTIDSSRLTNFYGVYDLISRIDLGSYLEMNDSILDDLINNLGEDAAFLYIETASYEKLRSKYMIPYLKSLNLKGSSFFHIDENTISNNSPYRLKRIASSKFISSCKSVEVQKLRQEIQEREIKLYSKAMANLIDNSTTSHQIVNFFNNPKLITNKSKDISFLSDDQIENIMTEILELDHLSFDYNLGGCYARAHEISYFLEEKNIISGKFFIQGKLKSTSKYTDNNSLNWTYHVVPFVLKKNTKGKVVKMIIDPSISSKALSLNNWLEQLTVSKNNQAVIIQTNRFTYSITQAKAEIVNKSWNISELQDNQRILLYNRYQREAYKKYHF